MKEYMNHPSIIMERMAHPRAPHKLWSDDSEYTFRRNSNPYIHVCLDLPMQWITPYARQGGVLRRTKETSQYGRRNLPNMECTRSVHIKHMCIISMSPLYVLGSM